MITRITRRFITRVRGEHCTDYFVRIPFASRPLMISSADRGWTWR